MYDIIFIGKKVKYFFYLKSIYPFIKHANTYEEARLKSLTKMFWAVRDNVEIKEDFKFDYQVPRWDQDYIHVFKNGKHFDGICLFPKHKEVSNRELEHRFFIDKKEIDIVASTPKPYDIFKIDTYDEYLYALEKSNTEMFWATSRNIKVKDDFKFDLYFTHSDEYDRKQNHVFIHRVDNEDLYNGLFLFSKHKPVSEKEIAHRHIIERKEWDIVASGPVQYDKFVIDSYKDYLNALEKSNTEMFWMIPKEVEIIDNSIFDLYFDHSMTYERNMHHSFKHQFREELNYNGIVLLSKNKSVSEREIRYRSLVEKKCYTTVATKLKPYDIIFISYNEPNADENFEKLKLLYPRAKRVHGVKGIHQAHIKAAEQAETEMFWVVDGDAVIVDNFKFDYQVPVWDQDVVHVWRSRNPINDLEYGYGGVKLFPRKQTLAMDVTKPDMTTSISSKFKAIQDLSNITSFNTDPFSTWKSAFRECVKLSSKIIDRQKSEETLDRLNTWSTVGSDRPYGEFAINGAKDAKQFVENNPTELFKINDFDWLIKVFKEKYESNS